MCPVFPHFMSLLYLACWTMTQLLWHFSFCIIYYILNHNACIHRLMKGIQFVHALTFLLPLDELGGKTWSSCKQSRQSLELTSYV
ncbi:hypothetical protein XELAEV_18004391mg [Xenopus laevis]|uniref:Uncharacterized protein n=1 Tax=Xenopus laevis TaxID=8355 RepID=A0A974GZR2_XENLA|nr:hypothetical protein XELAEV_18004391mg [Xenopus laevis]